VGRNQRKRAILGFLASLSRPATVPEIARGTRLPYDCRGLYSLLAAYAHWGLVLRSQSTEGRILYRLSERGRTRLAWLVRNR
jgi:hypothetical protein